MKQKWSAPLFDQSHSQVRSKAAQGLETQHARSLASVSLACQRVRGILRGFCVFAGHLVSTLTVE